MYISDNCNWTPYGTDTKSDELVNANSYYPRFVAAVNGYGLDKLVYDEDCRVREAIAKQGYGLDILINDTDSWIREAVAKQGYGLDILINDEDYRVRREVAKQGYGLDKLINDEDFPVRIAVAEQGYGLDKLIEDFPVRYKVEEYLRTNGYKSLEAWAKANPDKVYGEIDFDLINTIKDFVYKIDGSNSIHSEIYDEETKPFEKILVYITTRDTNVHLIKIEKRLKDEQKVYRFIVDIDDYDIHISSIVDSITTFNSTLEYIIETLKKYPQFNRYVIDLENCL